MAVLTDVGLHVEAFSPTTHMTHHADFVPSDSMIRDAKSDACQELGAFIIHHHALQRINDHGIYQRSRTIGPSKSDYWSVITCFSIMG